MDILYILFKTVQWFAQILSGLILVRCVISWLPINHGNRFCRFIYNMTEPILGPIRRIIARSPLGGPGMMIDFSPMIAILLIELVSNLLLRFIISLF